MLCWQLWLSLVHFGCGDTGKAPSALLCTWEIPAGELPRAIPPSSPVLGSAIKWKNEAQQLSPEHSSPVCFKPSPWAQPPPPSVVTKLQAPPGARSSQQGATAGKDVVLKPCCYLHYGQGCKSSPVTRNHFVPHGTTYAPAEASSGTPVPCSNFFQVQYDNSTVSRQCAAPLPLSLSRYSS